MVLDRREMGVFLSSSGGFARGLEQSIQEVFLPFRRTRCALGSLGKCVRTSISASRRGSIKVGDLVLRCFVFQKDFDGGAVVVSV